jgi:hypothetical protein
MKKRRWVYQARGGERRLRTVCRAASATGRRAASCASSCGIVSRASNAVTVGATYGPRPMFAGSKCTVLAGGDCRRTCLAGRVAREILVQRLGGLCVARADGGCVTRDK